MKIEQFQIEAQRTMRCIDKSENEHMILGMFTEIGELLGAHKKVVGYRQELDLVNVQEEIGDIMWYYVNYGAINNYKIEHIIKFTNMEYYLPLMFILSIMLDSDYNSKGAYTHVFSAVLAYCNNYNIDLEKCLDMNIAKLKKRYPEKFSNEYAVNRNTNEERIVLESFNENGMYREEL
jgi:NTP pyrophosphatase (non-canonical NTP hydrolase)